MERGSASAISALGAAVLGTTCCALPITLVALGAGSAVASLASAAPWLVWLSAHKAWTFGFSAAVLGYAWWQARRVGECDIAEGRRLRWQRGILWASTALLAASVFAAYALLPLQQFLERGGAGPG